MKTLKLGSKGEQVKTLQSMLGIVADGDFGSKTDTAVRARQKTHGLTVDGVVGPKTWGALMGEKVPAVVQSSAITFDADGWTSSARRFPIHPGRIGGTIEPKGVVVHTTDCVEGTMAGIIRRWTQGNDRGAGAHFFLGRRAPTAMEILDEEWPSAGLVQTCSIFKNGNHAGGSNGYGQPVINGRPEHPNRHYVGIELDGAGRLSKVQGQYIHPDSGKIVAPEHVFLDERGRPWHVITSYQFDVLGQLLDSLDAILPRFPTGTKIRPSGSYTLNGVRWAELPNVRFVGHVTLDPINKTDPGPQVVSWLREHYGDR